MASIMKWKTTPRFRSDCSALKFDNEPYMYSYKCIYVGDNHIQLEDLKVLRRSSDLFNNVKIATGQLQLIIKHFLLYHIWGLQLFWSNDLKQFN